MLSHKLRAVFRLVCKSPGLKSLAAVNLALAIGANSAVYSIVSAVLLKPLPYAEPGRIVMVFTLDPQTGNQGFSSYPDFADWQAETRSFAGMAVFTITSTTIIHDDPEQIHGALVSPNFFSVLGAHPLQGRGFETADLAGDERVVLLSHALWQGRFGGDPAVVGGTVLLSEVPYTVIGVLPASFEHPEPEMSPWRKPDFWAPLDPRPWQHRGVRRLRVIARLADGISLESAQAELFTIAEGLAAKHPEANQGVRVAVVPLRDKLLGDIGEPLTWAIFAAGFVLLIACANVAHLLLIEANARVRDVGIHMALGASRGAVVGQVLFESLALSCLGAVLGVFVADWVSGVLVALSPPEIVGIGSVAINLEVLGFTLGLALAAGLLSGAIPAFVTGRPGAFAALLTGQALVSGDRRMGWIRNALVVVEVAVPVPLLIGTALLWQSLAGLQAVQTGFGDHPALTFRLGSRFADPAARARFFDELADRLNGLPGVRAAGMVSSLPLTSLLDFEVPYLAERSEVESVGFATRITSGQYFEAIGIPLLQGRSFGRQDSASSPLVAIVNDLAAARLWSGHEAVGQRLRGGFSDAGWITVVGVVGSVRHRGLRQVPVPEIFVPYVQRADVVNNMAVVVAVDGTPASVLGAVRQTVWGFDDRLPLTSIATLEEVKARHFAIEKLFTVVGGSFTFVGLIQMLAGLIGVVAFWVDRRTRELAVRLALGARPRDLYRLLVGQCLALVAGGLVLGFAGSVAVAESIRVLLFNVGPTDAATFGTIAVIVALLATAASSWPARRVGRVDPAQVLRCD